MIRCNIDNYFFREPSTQRKLLDILFIYSKLNPDTGYRQGMHELLAPVLWVVYQDSIDVETVPSRKLSEDGSEFMLNVLDSRFVEHDAFNLFCAIMQTAKTFYEVGEGKDSSAIVAHSERIHNELLGAIDPDLCHHLQVIGIVPQIFAIRWLRLLFGREFEFKDVLKLWDILFAENLNVEIIDMACVAILLRLRWQLIDADYTTAITSITRLNLPKKDDSARAIIRDASELAKRRNAEAGADITQLRTGKRQYINPLSEEPIARVSTPQSRGHRRFKSQQASPSPSPARFSTPQRQLEGLFSNVSSNFQKGAEGWSVQNVSKALRGAVGEARRNIEQLQVNHSRSASVDIPRNSTSNEPSAPTTQTDLEDRLKKFEERNKALSAMLDTAQETLRKWKADNAQLAMQGEDAFNTALARIQFVSVYLTDADVPIPPSTPEVEKKQPPLQIEEAQKGTNSDTPEEAQLQTEPHPELQPTTKPITTIDAPQSQLQPDPPSPTPKSKDPKPDSTPPLSQPSISPSLPTLNTPDPTPPKSLLSASPPTSSTSSSNPRTSRPALSDSSFSFMLGESRTRTSLSFIRSKPLPEESRSAAAAATEPSSTKQKQDARKSMGVAGGKEKEKKKERRGSTTVGGKKDGGGKGDREEDEEGFTMSTLL